jgi:hypothetical protein
MKYVIDEETLSKNFREDQIEYFIKEYNFSRLEALIYLWSFNNFSTNTDEVKEDLGRSMYRKLAKKFSRLFEVQDD